MAMPARVVSGVAISDRMTLLEIAEKPLVNCPTSWR